MPIVWNSEADAKLLSAIIKVYEVKVTGAKLNEVAAIMGQGCTPKALTHRISKIRALAKSGEEGITNGVQSTPARKPRADAKAKPKSGGGGRKKKAVTTTPDGSDDEDAEGETRVDSPRPKRSGKKRDYAKMAAGDGKSEEEAEVDGLDKKIKIEVGEDIGEGLRQ